MTFLPSCIGFCGRNRRSALLFALLSLLYARLDGQLYLDCLGAPSVQTIHLQEATITDGYKPVLLGEGGLRLRYRLPKSFGIRLGTSLVAKGANLEILADSAGGHSEGTAAFRANFLTTAVGAEYGSKLSDRLTLIGSLDFVYGGLVRSSIRMVRGTGTLVYKDFFHRDFLGLDLGLALEYELPGGIGFRFSPKLELHLNYVYRSSFFKPKFNGFAPQIEVHFPLYRPKP